MLPANLSRSAHYLNLQPQQPPLNPPLSTSLPLPFYPSNGHSPISFFSSILSLLCSLRPPPHSSSLCLSHHFSLIWISLGWCFCKSAHCFLYTQLGGEAGLSGRWREGVGPSLWEGSGFLARFFLQGRRILGFSPSLSLSPFPHSLFPSRLASLCDLWSLTPCLHMGGHGCGEERGLKVGGIGGGFGPKRRGKNIIKGIESKEIWGSCLRSLELEANLTLHGISERVLSKQRVLVVEWQRPIHSFSQMAIKTGKTIKSWFRSQVLFFFFFLSPMEEFYHLTKQKTDPHNISRSQSSNICRV